MKIHHLTLIASVLLAVTLHPAAAQTQPDGTPKTPSTIRMRVENAQDRHDKALADLLAIFDRVAKEPQLISSKEVIDAIDQGDRAMKNTKTACGSMLTALRAESKAIMADASFSEDQKTELLTAVESLVARCETLTYRSTVTIKHLETAYKAMGQWRKVYKTYLNLDGEAKARKQLETSVQEYVKGLTAEPEAVGEEAEIATGAENKRTSGEKTGE